MCLYLVNKVIKNYSPNRRLITTKNVTLDITYPVFTYTCKMEKCNICKERFRCFTNEELILELKPGSTVASIEKYLWGN